MANKIPGREPDLTVKEVAEAIRLNPETVRIMARQGVFPNAYKTGPALPPPISASRGRTSRNIGGSSPGFAGSWARADRN